MSGPLGGLHLLVTRPAHQAEPLCQLIEAQGGTALRFPTLEIEVLHETITLPAHIDILIFISANAVEHGLPLLGNITEHTQVAAVGNNTARALSRHGINTNIVPQQQFDSEGLLAHPQLENVSNRQIVIVRGESGRDLLGDSLHQRGAHITYLPCYRRALPQVKTDNVLHQALQKRQLDIILIHSGEALQNLLTLCADEDMPALLGTRLAVIHHKQAELATRLGFLQPAIISQQADDDSLLAAVIHWQQHRQSENG